MAVTFASGLADAQETTASATGTRVARPRGMQRRIFCRGACQALTCVALGTLVDGCAGSPTAPSDGNTSAPALPTVSGSVANGVVTLAIADGSPLGTVGGAALLQTPSGAFLVNRTAVDQFAATTAVCTHEGCTITGFTDSVYVCPCHGSRFTPQGGVVAGPAGRALQRFTTSFANNVLTITV